MADSAAPASSAASAGAAAASKKRKRQWKPQGPDGKAHHGADGLSSLKGHPGIFVVTARNKERSGAREVIALLDQAAPAAPLASQGASIAQQIAKDVAEAAKGEPQMVETGVECLILLTSEQDPVKPVFSIFDMLIAKGRPCSRFVEKIVPLQIVCHASLDVIKANVTQLLNKRIEAGPLPSSFAVVQRIRHSDMDKTVLIDTLASLVDQSACKVNLSAPGLVIHVEILRNIAGCSIFEGDVFAKYAKLNIRNLFAKDAAPKVKRSRDD